MNDTCSLCKQKVEMTISFSTAGKPPTPPICQPCLKRRGQEIVNKLKRGRGQS